MKRNIYMVLLAALFLAAGTSCEKEYDLRSVDRAFTEALLAAYPQATFVEWERNRDWYVAEFNNNGGELKVWYNANAQWCMTESDVHLNDSSFPVAVLEAFAASGYASWRVDDADKYERPGEVFYLIEVEKSGGNDRMLFYSESGELLKDVKERGDVLPDIKL